MWPACISPENKEDQTDILVSNGSLPEQVNEDNGGKMNKPVSPGKGIRTEVGKHLGKDILENL